MPEPSDKYKTLEALFPVMEKELKNRGMTRQIHMGKVHNRPS